MLVRKMFGILPAVALLCTTVACGSKSSSKKKVQSIFLHGDPLSLLKDATSDKASFFKVASIGDFADFNLVGGVYFHEKSPESTATSAEEGQEASTGEETGTLGHYKFEVLGANYVYRDPSDDQAPALYFSQGSGGSLELEGIAIGQATSSVEIVHYSLKTNKDAFSVLLKVTDPDDGDGLLGLMFTKNVVPAVSPTQVEKIYKYLAGPGVVAKWSGDIQIKICGNPPAADAADMRLGLEAWAKNNKIGKQNLVIGTQATKVPFTDMNTSCVALVDDFSFEDQENLAVYGITISTLNGTSGLIDAANIVIANKAFSKTPDLDTAAHRSIFMRYVVAHEFGHFLGLDHEFTKDSNGKAVYESIMSYEFDNIFDYSPRAHDEEAIALLYPN